MNNAQTWFPQQYQVESVRLLNEEQMKAYFEIKSEIKWLSLALLALAGILCIAVAYLLPSGWFIFVLVGMIFFGASSYFGGVIKTVRLHIESKIKGVPDDWEYDAWVEDRASQRFDIALCKLNQDYLSDQAKADVLRVQSFVYETEENSDRYHSEDLLRKWGKDGLHHYNVIVFTYFLPIERQLAIIGVDVNAVRQKERREEIHEVYYEDIVDILTIVEDKVFGTEPNEFFFRKHTITVSLRGGKGVSVAFLSIFLDKVPAEMPGSSSIDSQVDDTIAEIRSRIKSSKGKGLQRANP